MTIEVRFADKQVDRAALFAFRYRIYVEEMRRPQSHADHQARQIRDSLDLTAHNLVAWDREEIVGCIRVNFARDGGLAYYRKLLRMDAVGEAWPFAVSLTTRLMVHPDWRKSSLAVRLGMKAFALGLREAIRFDFIDCNDHLAPMFRRLGYVSTHRPVHYDYGEVNAMRLDLYDRAHLAATGSPFSRAFSRRKLEWLHSPSAASAG